MTFVPLTPGGGAIVDMLYASVGFLYTELPGLINALVDDGIVWASTAISHACQSANRFGWLPLE